jgi:hypothetical protein
MKVQNLVSPISCSTKRSKKLKVERTAVAETSESTPQKLLREAEWGFVARNHNRLENTLLGMD